jgi:hypothetical protein
VQWWVPCRLVQQGQALYNLRSYQRSAGSFRRCSRIKTLYKWAGLG